MKVLAIESTCDETSAAVVESFGTGVRVVTNIVASSAEIHAKYGGVIPEVAAREQINSMIPVIQEALTAQSVEAVAVSYGPGLMGSLLVGVETAKSLAWSWGLPLLKVNHMAAHVFANWIISEENQQTPPLPAVGLIVSGGHTDLILIKSFSDWEWIGGTRDDAVGEAFDKTARILGLPYPGGPAIDKVSDDVSDDVFNNRSREYHLPRPLINDDSLEMSFSGLKAAVFRLRDSKKEMADQEMAVVAREFSESVVEVLVKKTLRAVEKYSPRSVLLAGGVAANKSLRTAMEKSVREAGLRFFMPEIRYCGDNGAMVGAAAIMQPVKGEMDLHPEPGLASV